MTTTTTDSILRELERAIKSRDFFANAKVWQRGEMPGDEHPEEYAIYLEPGNPEPEDSSFAMRFRQYPVLVTVKYQITDSYGAHDFEDEHNAVQNRSNVVIEEILDLYANFVFANTDAYHFDIAEVEREPEISDDLKTEDGMRRITFEFVFYTVKERIAAE